MNFWVSVKYLHIYVHSHVITTLTASRCVCSWWCQDVVFMMVCVCLSADQCYNMTPLIDQELEKIDRYQTSLQFYFLHCSGNPWLLWGLSMWLQTVNPCLKSPFFVCALYIDLSHLTTNLILYVFVYSLCVMMCICRILIKITYLLIKIPLPWQIIESNKFGGTVFVLLQQSVYFSEIFSQIM